MKRLKRTVFYFLIGFILAILWGIKNITILFIIPILILILQEKKRLKILSFFIIGFFILFIPYAVWNHYTAIEHVSWDIKIKEHLSNIYDTVLSNAAILGQEEVKPIEEEGFKFKEIKLIDDFENREISYTLRSGKKCKLSLSNKSQEGKQSLKAVCSLPLKEDLTIGKDIKSEDWSQYNYINLWISSEGEMESFEFIIEEYDGDRWHYFDEKVLQKEGWQSLLAPFRKFENPSWAGHGNRRRNFDKIINFELNFNSYEGEQEGNYTVYIDKIYLST